MFQRKSIQKSNTTDIQQCYDRIHLKEHWNIALNFSNMEQNEYSVDVFEKPAENIEKTSSAKNIENRDAKAFFDQLPPDCYFGCFKDCVLCRVGQDNFVVDRCLDTAEFGYVPVGQTKGSCPCKRGCNCTRGCPNKPDYKEDSKPPCQAEKRQNEYLETILEFLKSRGDETAAAPDKTTQEKRQPTIRDICQCFPTYGLCEEISKANRSEIPLQSCCKVLEQDTRYEPQPQLADRSLILKQEINKLEKQKFITNNFLSAQKAGLAKELAKALPYENAFRDKQFCRKEKENIALNEQKESCRKGNIKVESQTSKHVYNINIKLEDPKNKVNEQPSECSRCYHCCKCCQQGSDGNSRQKKNPVETCQRQKKPIGCNNTLQSIQTYECTPVLPMCNNVTHNNEQLLANETITNCFEPLACTTNKPYLHESERLLKDNEQLVRRNELLMRNNEQLMRNNEHVVHNNENIIQNNEKIIHITKCLTPPKKKLVQNNQTLACTCKPPLTASKDPLAHECNDPSRHKYDGLAYNPDHVCFKGGKCGPHSCTARLGAMVFGPNACKCDDPYGMHCNTLVATNPGERTKEGLKVIVHVKNPQMSDTGQQRGQQCGQQCGLQCGTQCGFPSKTNPPRLPCDIADERCKCLCQGDVKHRLKPALMPRDYCCLIPNKPIEEEKPQRNCKYLLAQRPRGEITDYQFPSKLCDVPQFACPVEIFEQRDDFTWRFSSCPKPCDDITKVMCEVVPGLERRRLSMCDKIEEERKKVVEKVVENQKAIPPKQDVSKDQPVESKPSVLKKPKDEVVVAKEPPEVQKVPEKEVKELKVVETESDFQKAQINNLVKDQLKPKQDSGPPSTTKGAKGKAKSPKVTQKAAPKATPKAKSKQDVSKKPKKKKWQQEYKKMIK